MPEIADALKRTVRDPSCLDGLLALAEVAGEALEEAVAEGDADRIGSLLLRCQGVLESAAKAVPVAAREAAVPDEEWDSLVALAQG